MKSNINPRITDISFTYILFIAMVIIPNLILGFFGFITLREHETSAETNMKRAYEIVASNLIDEINGIIANTDKEVLNTEKFETVEETVENFDNVLAKFSNFKHMILVDKKGKFTFEKSIEDNAREDFAKKYRLKLFTRIDDFSGKYPTRFIIDSAVDGELASFFCFAATLENMRGNAGTIVLMYDAQRIYEGIIKNRFESLDLNTEVSLKLHQGGKKRDFSEKTLLTINWEGNVFPYWHVAVNIERIEEFRKNARSASTIFLIIFGLLLPLVGGALIGLRFKLLRDMRVAHLKTDFISRVTHELRTPLTSIKMFSEMLVMESIPEKQKKNCIDIIQRETERLTKLVDRVLNFSKLESRNKVFTFALTDIEKLVVETVRFFEKQIPDKEFKIKLLKDPRIREVTVDKDGIREILLNLIENSYKYSGEDKEITVKIQKIENDMKIVVIDNGFGIPREDLNRIFQKFYRVDDQINRAIDGTGLGLSICRDIAKAHGGSIVVESERGAGSKFIVSIPLKFNPAQWAKYLVQKKNPWE